MSPAESHAQLLTDSAAMHGTLRRPSDPATAAALDAYVAVVRRLHERIEDRAEYQRAAAEAWEKWQALQAARRAAAGATT